MDQKSIHFVFKWNVIYKREKSFNHPFPTENNCNRLWICLLYLKLWASNEKRLEICKIGLQLYGLFAKVENFLRSTCNFEASLVSRSMNTQISILQFHVLIDLLWVLRDELERSNFWMLSKRRRATKRKKGYWKNPEQNLHYKKKMFHSETN